MLGDVPQDLFRHLAFRVHNVQTELPNVFKPPRIGQDKARVFAVEKKLLNMRSINTDKLTQVDIDDSFERRLIPL